MATAASTSLPITLPPLPYPENALEPVISAKTLSFHYGKHHRTYVETTNKLIVGTELADLPLEKIVTATAGKADRVSIFNNAAQAWNHNFYWKCLKSKGGGEPASALKRRWKHRSAVSMPARRSSPPPPWLNSAAAGRGSSRKATS